MKIIFLDIDGVLNHKDHYHSINYTSYKSAKKQLRKDVKAERIDRLDYYKSQINDKSISLLNKLCDLTNAVVVISSTWRMGQTIEQLQETLNYCGGTFNIIDKTSVMSFEKINGLYQNSVPRGCEIDKWLCDHGYSFTWSEEKMQEAMVKSGIDNFIILIPLPVAEVLNIS